jgi:hypothetical protein
MKTLKAGLNLTWWVGLLINCERCGCKVKLEFKEYSKLYILDNGSLRYYCDMCGNMMELKPGSIKQQLNK